MNSLLLLHNDLSEAEEELQGHLFELRDKVQASLNWCAEIPVVYHLPLPMLITIIEDGTIHNIFEDATEGNIVAIVRAPYISVKEE